MQKSFELSLALFCLILASSSLAQEVTNTTTTTTSVVPVTVTNVTNVTSTITPNTTAALNETITIDSSNNGTTIVTTTPIDATTNATGTPVNTSIALDQLRNFEQTGSSIPLYATQNYTLYMVDIHFTSGNLSAQYIAHHFCHFVTEDLMQCALFDNATANSRFLGNEYFITKAVFDTLPAAERNLWHSHPFEVQSGLFVAPDLSEDDEFVLLEWLMGTFGKVTETWDYFLDFPLGAPQLGLALALDSQVNWDLVDQMDQLLNLNTTWQQRRQARASLIAPPKSEGADNYLVTGNATQYQTYQIPLGDDNGSILPNNTNTTAQ